MPTGNRYACIPANILTSLQDASDSFNGQQMDRHTHNAQSHDGCAAHCVDIAYGISGSDAAKVIRVVDGRYKKIGFSNQGLFIIGFVNGGIVCRFNANH